MAAEKAMSKTQERVVKLISQPSSKRSPVEVNLVLPWLKKKSDILFALADNILKDIVLNCEYLKTEKDELIIRQGDPGDCLYLLLKGFVSVYINEKKPGDEQSDGPIQVQKQEEETTSSKNWLDVANEIVGDINGERKVNKNVDRKTLGRKIVTFGSGKAFGEIALLSEENVRTASVIADDECDLLIIRRKLYNSTVKTYHEKDFQERREFINNSPLFMTWSDKHKKQLERGLIKESYSPDMPIIKQGEELRGLIFIRGGMAKVMVEPDKHGTQYPHMVPFPTENDIFELEHIRPHRSAPKHKTQHASKDHHNEGEDKSRVNSPKKTQVTFENVQVKRKQGYAAAEKRVLNRSIILCTVKDGAMFGDVEMMHNLKTYSQSVIALTYTEIYYITSKNVERLIQKRHPKTIKLLTDIVVWKMCNRATSVQGSIVPFVKHLVFKMTEEKKPVPRTLPVLPNMSKHLPEREAMFHNILQEYLKDKAQLIEPIVAGGIYYKTVMRKKAKQREVVRRKKEESKRQIIENEMRAKMTHYSHHLQRNMANAWLDTEDDEEPYQHDHYAKQQPKLEAIKPIPSLLQNVKSETEELPEKRAFLTEVEITSNSSSLETPHHQKVHVKKPRPDDRHSQHLPAPPPLPKNNHTICYVYDESTGASVVKHVGSLEKPKSVKQSIENRTPSSEQVDNNMLSISSNCTSDDGVNMSGVSESTEDKNWVSRAPSDGRMVGAPAHMISKEQSRRSYSESHTLDLQQDISNSFHETYSDSPQLIQSPTQSERNVHTMTTTGILPSINDSGGGMVGNQPVLVRKSSSDSGCFEDGEDLPYADVKHRARTAISTTGGERDSCRSGKQRENVIVLPKVKSAGNKRMSTFLTTANG